MSTILLLHTQTESKQPFGPSQKLGVGHEYQYFTKSEILNYGGRGFGSSSFTFTGELGKKILLEVRVC